EEHYAKEIEAHLAKLDVYKKVFEPIPGMGPKISGRIISAIGDLRRFETCWALTAYMGYHVRPDGTCPRRRKGIASPEAGKAITKGSDRRVDFGGWNTLGRQGLYLWAEQINKASPKKDDGRLPFKKLLVGRKAYLARKGWISAVNDLKKSGDVSSELIDFITAMEMACEDKNAHNIPNWFYNGGKLIEDAQNPYITAVNSTRVQVQPWELRDALKELLKPKKDRKEFPSLPKMEISIEMKREINRFCKSQWVSKKRLHLGSYRWLINSVLIRRYIWPEYRKFLGLPPDLDPRKLEPSEQKEVGQNHQPVRYDTLADEYDCGLPSKVYMPMV
ncbi:MAG: transposase, partial [bacterium]|nr:transposase [bacterium]